MSSRMSAEDYFRDEVFRAYRYLLRLKLPHRSPVEQKEYEEHMERTRQRVSRSMWEFWGAEEKRREAKVKDAARYVLNLLGPVSVDDAERQIMAFITPETSKTPRSRSFVLRIQEVFRAARM